MGSVTLFTQVKITLHAEFWVLVQTCLESMMSDLEHRKARVFVASAHKGPRNNVEKTLCTCEPSSWQPFHIKLKMTSCMCASSDQACPHNSTDF